MSQNSSHEESAENLEDLGGSSGDASFMDYADSASEEGAPPGHISGAAEDTSGVGDTAAEAEAEELIPEVPTKHPRDLVLRVIRVPREERRTQARMSLAEYSSVLSTRIKQIEAFGKSFAVTTALTARELAILELQERRCPILLVREVGRRGSEAFEEAWSPNEMAHPM